MGSPSGQDWQRFAWERSCMANKSRNENLRRGQARRRNHAEVCAEAGRSRRSVGRLPVVQCSAVAHGQAPARLARMTIWICQTAASAASCCPRCTCHRPPARTRTSRLDDSLVGQEYRRPSRTRRCTLRRLYHIVASSRLRSRGHLHCSGPSTCHVTRMQKRDESHFPRSIFHLSSRTW
jgi:hypothetical protein